ncbi:hypothetical protein Taro_007907 [Colocasia esculenta]|uniref:Uncharacterized protein n=1 Tax=Colocasia esculenta TaxID=4460 RepID=A0A843TZL0_COLES|nr:hypothetical protein [Colocasia esculenta]
MVIWTLARRAVSSLFSLAELLGRDCHDIDIALDKMLGREFCEKKRKEELKRSAAMACDADSAKWGGGGPNPTCEKVT